MKGCQIQYFEDAPQLVVFHLPCIIPRKSCGCMTIHEMGRLENMTDIVRRIQEIAGVEQLLIAKHRVAITIGAAFLADDIRRLVVSDVLYELDTCLGNEETPDTSSQPSYIQSYYPPATYDCLLKPERERYKKEN